MTEYLFYQTEEMGKGGISAVNRKKPLEIQLVDGVIVAEVKEVIERGEKNG